MTNHLAGVAQTLVSGGRGILAMDEPASAGNRRFAQHGVAQSADQHRALRELTTTAPGLERFVAGVVLHEETLRSRTADGRRFAGVLRERGIVPGADLNADGTPPGRLRERLAEYAALGAGFAKVRAADARVLAHAAALCQLGGIVPVVMPDTGRQGDHDIARSGAIAERVLRHLFAELAEAGVALEAMVLECDVVAPGRASAQTAQTPEVIAATLRVLGATVPVAVAGVAFPTGQDRVATERLCALNKTMPRRRPWPLSFTFGRELKDAVIEAWRGRDDRIAEAQRILVHRAYCSGLAACGAYTAKVEDQIDTFAPPIAA